MAVFAKSISRVESFWDLSEFQTPPEGTYLATCIDIVDKFGVVRSKFEKPTEMETVDLTAFLFGFRDDQGTAFKIASGSMTISGNEKSNLYKFLLSWLGKPFPFGQDYAAPVAQGGMKGRQALITVNHKPKRDGSGAYPILVSATPVPTGLFANTGGASVHTPPVPQYGAKPAGGNGGQGNGYHAPTMAAPPPPIPVIPASAFTDEVPF